MSVIAAEVRSRPIPWVVVSLTVAMAATLGAALVVIALPVVLVLALVMVLAGAPYGVVAMIVIRSRWARAWRDDVMGEDPITTPAVTFSTIPQRFSFVLTLLLLINLIIGFIAIVLGLSEALISVNAPIAIVAGLMLVGFNRAWAFSPEMVNVETAVLRDKYGAWRLVRLNRILSWIVWLAYTLLGLVAAGSGVVGIFSQTG